ncbi:response regulator [Marinicellulosiphila megalodicopiae]|uniref:response regulator n=1 Tax=Marinicellulosiphila megalodicopiae TaxID=2724896 RepID=UPI003BB0AAFC
MAQLSILIVDDASFIRDLVKRSLRQHIPHAKVDEAINGRKAQILLQKNKYDLILCDWEMPELSGIELLTWLRPFEIEKNRPKTAFIMVTSRGDKENVVEAVKSGVTDYIGKPFSAEQLLTKVIKALGAKAKPPAGRKTSGDPALLEEAVNPLLASAAPKQSTSTNQSSNLLNSNSASNQLVEKNKPKSSVIVDKKPIATTTIRTASTQATVNIRDINLQQVLLEVDADTIKPQILEQVVIDIQIGEGIENVARINTYVHLVQVIGTTQSNQLLVKLNYVDDDEDKMMMLTKYIASVRR